MNDHADFQALYAQHHHEMEDFWSRRRSRLAHKVEFRLFGRLVRMTSNDFEVLSSADFSRPLYSAAPETNEVPFVIQIIVHASPRASRNIPDDLVEKIHYTGNEHWLNIGFGEWGNCFVQMAEGRATAVLTPEFAKQPELVSRCMLDTIFTNLFTRNGFAMLHATALVRNESILMLMAPHGGGKSTTALHLLLKGNAVLTDSMVFVTMRKNTLQLTGFPVGRIKLRQDMLPLFPQVRPFLSSEQVRGETKYTLDLKLFAPDQVCTQALSPARLVLCLMKRHDQAESFFEEARPESVWESVMHNSLHFDTLPIWQSNLELIAEVVQRARWYHLFVGTDPQQLVRAVNAIW